MTHTRTILLALAFLGCTSPTAPVSATIEGATSYTSSLHAERWALMEGCSGLRGDFSRVKFYTAKRIVYQGVEVRGYWRRADNSIFLLESLKDNTTAIGHEETHALLQAGGHPAHYFIDGPCGNLMLP